MNAKVKTNTKRQKKKKETEAIIRRTAPLVFVFKTQEVIYKRK